MSIQPNNSIFGQIAELNGHHQKLTAALEGFIKNSAKIELLERRVNDFVNFALTIQTNPEVPKQLSAEFQNLTHNITNLGPSIISLKPSDGKASGIADRLAKVGEQINKIKGLLTPASPAKPSGDPAASSPPAKGPKPTAAPMEMTLSVPTDSIPPKTMQHLKRGLEKVKNSEYGNFLKKFIKEKNEGNVFSLSLLLLVLNWIKENDKIENLPEFLLPSSKDISSLPDLIKKADPGFVQAIIDDGNAPMSPANKASHEALQRILQACSAPLVANSKLFAAFIKETKDFFSPEWDIKEQATASSSKALLQSLIQDKKWSEAEVIALSLRESMGRDFALMDIVDGFLKENNLKRAESLARKIDSNAARQEKLKIITAAMLEPFNKSLFGHLMTIESAFRTIKDENGRLRMHAQIQRFFNDFFEFAIPSINQRNLVEAEKHAASLTDPNEGDYAYLEILSDYAKQGNFKEAERIVALIKDPKVKDAARAEILNGTLSEVRKQILRELKQQLGISSDSPQVIRSQYPEATVQVSQKMEEWLRNLKK